ncbi:MAG: zf-TFIIB domain-containing protein [Pirellulaceae bacterium]
MNANHERPTRSFDQGGVTTDRSAGFVCPTCHSELRIGAIEKTQFAGCDRCGGMLFQQSVFGMVIMHLRANYVGATPIPSPMNPDELRVHRTCTVCDSMMETYPYAGPGNSVIDSCQQCQLIWLDAGELDRLVEAPGRRIR